MSDEALEPRPDYPGMLDALVRLLERSRYAVARAVNVTMTTTYREIGRRLVEYDQGGAHRAGYGQALLKQLSADLTMRFGRGFSERNLEQMRLFYQHWPISQTSSAKSATVSTNQKPPAFALP